jgi:hypothetical protein
MNIETIGLGIIMVVLTIGTTTAVVECYLSRPSGGDQ